MQSTNLRRRGNKFNHLLECSSTVLVECDRDQLGCCVVDEASTLIVVRVFKELLTQVIAKGI